MIVPASPRRDHAGTESGSLSPVDVPRSVVAPGRVFGPAYARNPISDEVADAAASALRCRCLAEEHREDARAVRELVHSITGRNIVTPRELVSLELAEHWESVATWWLTVGVTMLVRHRSTIRREYFQNGGQGSDSPGSCNNPEKVSKVRLGEIQGASR